MAHLFTLSSYAQLHIIRDLGKLCDRFSYKAMQCLGFQIVLQPHQPAFSAVARLLVTAEGRAVVEATSWSAPVEWSSSNVSAWSAFGLSGRCFWALVDGNPERCVV